MTNQLLIFAATALAFAHSFASEKTAVPTQAVLADVKMLESVGAKVLAVQSEVGVGFARLTPVEQEKLSRLSHEFGRCAGFQALSNGTEPKGLEISHVFGQLAEQRARNQRFHPSTAHFSSLALRAEIAAALDEVSENELRSHVTFFSSYKTRDHRSANANQSMLALKQRIETALQGTKLNYQIDMIDHRSTAQDSVRLRILGSKRPSEIVVLGAHADSINWECCGSRPAPGADDNASGTANLIEAVRILASRPQPERTVEFMWYAGEEGGLLGSSEIAADYKRQGKDVIAMVQLDMTLFPGDGELVIGSMTDYTSAWLRSYFAEVNNLYLNVKIIDDECGYGCSDHVSWYRQGYPSLLPAEATMSRMNDKLHTTRDVIESASSFKHSAVFSKLAIAVAMDLGNSMLREP